jgi:hypothetical protein
VSTVESRLHEVAFERLIELRDGVVDVENLEKLRPWSGGDPSVLSVSD